MPPQIIGDFRSLVSRVQRGAQLIRCRAFHGIYVCASFDQNPHNPKGCPGRCVSESRFTFDIATLEISPVSQGQPHKDRVILGSGLL